MRARVAAAGPVAALADVVLRVSAALRDHGERQRDGREQAGARAETLGASGFSFCEVQNDNTRYARGTLP